jgi:hypothetical protein
MGQKMVRFAQLGAARFRQDESMEVGEVGSKRPSSGGNGGHVVWWIGLIFRLLLLELPKCPPRTQGRSLLMQRQKQEDAKRVWFM